MFSETYMLSSKTVAIPIYDLLRSLKNLLQTSSRLTLLLIFSLATVNRAQGNITEKQLRWPISYVVDSWGIENGLPQSSVTSIVQTRDGYI